MEGLKLRPRSCILATTFPFPQMSVLEILKFLWSWQPVVVGSGEPSTSWSRAVLACVRT